MAYLLKQKSAVKLLGIVLISCTSFWYISRTIYRNMDWKNNTTLWSSAVSNNPTSYIAAVALGKQYLLQNNLTAAAQTYENILEVYPNHTAITVFLTNLYIHQKNYPKALHHGLHATKLSPNNPTIWVTLGDIYTATGQSSLASDAYTRALQLDPTNAATKKKIVR